MSLRPRKEKEGRIINPKRMRGQELKDNDLERVNREIEKVLENENDSDSETKTIFSLNDLPAELQSTRNEAKAMTVGEKIKNNTLFKKFIGWVSQEKLDNARVDRTRVGEEKKIEKGKNFSLPAEYVKLNKKSEFDRLNRQLEEIIETEN